MYPDLGLEIAPAILAGAVTVAVLLPLKLARLDGPSSRRLVLANLVVAICTLIGGKLGSLVATGQTGTL